MSSYPGSDPDDPFSRPPRENPEDRPAPGPDETAPIRAEEIGYWERLAQQGQPGQPGQQTAQDPGQPTAQDPGQPPATYPYGPPAYAGYALPAHPRATTAMVLGLVGLVGGVMTCGLLMVLSPFAWVVGARTKREIRESQGQLGGEGNAQAGFVMGIIGTVLLVLIVLAVALIVVLIVIGLNSSVSTGSGGSGGIPA